MEQTQALRPAFTPRDHPLKNKYEGPGLDMGHVKARPLISKKMAEREGFEPSKELSSFTRLAGERLQPSRPSLRKAAENFLAEGVGFEPTVPLGTAVFKTAAFSHSAIPPVSFISFYFNIICLNSQSFSRLIPISTHK